MGSFSKKAFSQYRAGKVEDGSGGTGATSVGETKPNVEILWKVIRIVKHIVKKLR